MQGLAHYYTITGNTCRANTLKGFYLFVFSGAVVTTGTLTANIALQSSCSPVPLKFP